MLMAALHSDNKKHSIVRCTTTCCERLNHAQVSPEERVFMPAEDTLEQDTAEATLAVHGSMPQQVVQPLSAKRQQ